VKQKPRDTRRRPSRRTELRRAPKQAALRLAKDAARRLRLKEEATKPLVGVALLSGVVSLFAFTIAASVVGVALLVASYWGKERARDRRPRAKGAKGRKLTLLAE